jgi:DNA invertase Pin-like site-specific DNA recombinase
MKLTLKGGFVMRYGYARCSTNETKQDIDRQVRELKASGAESIRLEYEHGDSEVKPELDTLLKEAKAGDTIITLEVSRLSRSTKQLCSIIEQVQQKYLMLIIVGSITINCTTGSLDPMTEAFLKMAGVFAELELKMIRARVKSGMENARAKGKRIGRPNLTKDSIPSMFYKHYPLYANGGLNKIEMSRLCNISRPTLDKYLALIKK